jgi:hypothetical protein
MANFIVIDHWTRFAFIGWRVFLSLLVLSEHSRKEPFMGKMEMQL